MLRCCMVVGLCFLVITAFSQTKITGIVTDDSRVVIAGATVMITAVGSDDILAYDITNEKGAYAVAFDADETSIQVNVRALNYRFVSQVIKNSSQAYDFELGAQATELKEIMVTGSPITIKGDTINYIVNSFADAEDRSIADVLKRIPGIDVLSDGKVLYQGKPINKYYIEGLDLLEGKYNLANENLPYKEVTKVQIIENHQPLKILDSLVYSDKAALNIVLKNKYAFTGQAEIGTGFSPLLWDVNITPMLFTSKQQMLTSYQANNTGKNIAKQLKKLTIEDLIENFENNSERQDWLSIRQLSPPNFSEGKWLDNRANLLTTNYLRKIRKNYELRFNVSYLNDYQQQRGALNTLYFTSTDTIVLTENKYNQLYFNALETNLTLLKNTKENYLKNSLQFDGFWDSQKGNILLGNEPSVQNLSNRYFTLSNKLKTIFSIGKQLMTLNSYLRLNKIPQSLRVSPGQLQELLNNGIDYDEVSQKIKQQTFYTHNSISFTRKWKKITFSPRFGFQLEQQNLESHIFVVGDVLSEEFSNDLDWLKSKAYVDVQTHYKRKKWRIELNTPLNLYSFDLKDKPLQKEQGLTRLAFEPRMSFIYDLNAFWKLNASFRLNNQFGSIQQLHYGYILKDYRNLQRINTPMPETFSQNLNAGLTYKNPIKSLFSNFLYSYSVANENLLYTNQVQDNGAIELQAIAERNKRKNHLLSGRGRLFISTLNTNLTVTSTFTLSDFTQIVNSEVVQIKINNTNLEGKIDTDISSWLGIEYQGNFIFSKSKVQNQGNRTVVQQQHKLNLNIRPAENQYIGLKSEYITNDLFVESANNFLVDLIYRYTWKKKKIDFELHWSNIFGAAEYQAVSVNSFSYAETTFPLRPMQILLSARFSF